MSERRGTGLKRSGLRFIVNNRWNAAHTLGVTKATLVAAHVN